ncbi:transmembrane protein 272-like [Cylas formicarius]|uniref:transmembrane protein 272-like n=1 Tax=Cylas formicarius TaxID=197179 RepID=UPI0029588EDD|nr:transmembrane protein 272-like [Cylas formicarius]
MAAEKTTAETSSASGDVEKQEIATTISSGEENNNHFFEEKVKERPPPGINGSLVFLYAIFFSEFTVGWVSINNCPLNVLIPVYLILAGFLGALAKFLSKFEHKWCFYATIVLVVICVAWHGLGTYVVYKEYQPNYEPAKGVYCSRTAYLIAFWTLTFEYTLLLMFIFLSCSYMIMRGDFRKCE